MTDVIARLDAFRAKLGQASPQWPVITAAMQEIERLHYAKRRALAVVDMRSMENVALRAEVERLRAAV
jgi:hypothetical protein